MPRPAPAIYDAADFIAILRYAHARHIEVIPEFNMPGHARAAVVAMRARHDRLLAAGEADDAERISARRSRRCLGLRIGADVARQRDLHRAALGRPLHRHGGRRGRGAVPRAGVPLRAIHTGGDEVPAGAWLGSPRCRR
jgi:hexosaminidase